MGGSWGKERLRREEAGERRGKGNCCHDIIYERRILKNIKGPKEKKKQENREISIRRNLK